MATAVHMSANLGRQELTSAETYVSVEEYLRTPYRPDVEYIEGHLEERNVGEAEHSRFQLILSAMFPLHEDEWGILTYPDCRLQVKEDRYRVPDLLVVSVHEAPSRIGSAAPLLCIEILSPEDTITRLLDRVEDYSAMGVRCTWVFDLYREDVLVCTDREKRWTAEKILSVPGTSIAIDREELSRRYRKSLPPQG